jgi:hypothetical protein
LIHHAFSPRSGLARGLQWLIAHGSPVGPPANATTGGRVMATTTTIRIATLVCLVTAGLQAAAQDTRIEALERAFWRCDHAATQGVLAGSTAMDCSVVTETFKARRFGGDFSAMLAWWRERKDAEHQALAAAQHATRLVVQRP